MSEDKVKVKTSDGDIVEVDLEVAKLWGPINNMYEGNFTYYFFKLTIYLKNFLFKVFGSIDTKNPVELENVNTETLKKVIRKKNKELIYEIFCCYFY